MTSCSVCGSASEVTGGPSDASSRATAVSLYPVTANGKPNGYVKGYICASCLHEANEARLCIKSGQADVGVTKHALDRYLEREKGQRIPEEAAKMAILKLFGQAHQIVFRDAFMAERLLNNGQPADYYFNSGWIFVVTQDVPRTIMTSERQWHRRLGRDFWYA